ncbi:MAG: S9 family peptidase [Phycisphaerales bacterium]|nr:S9 family peptidase [Phycisphaerales bacterium]
MNPRTRLALALIALAGLAVPVARAQDAARKPASAPAADSKVRVSTPLIPRQTLFGNPTKAQGRISPDGKTLAFLAPVNGVLNVHVAPVGELDKAKAVTSDTKRGIRQYFWAYNGQIVYIQDTAGDENWRLYSVNPADAAVKDLTPIPGVQARVEAVSRKFPGEIVVGLNDRDPQLHDLYRIDLASGKRTLLMKNEQFAGVMVDDQFVPRIGVRQTEDGGEAYSRIVSAGDEKTPAKAEPLMTVGQEDTGSTRAVDFSADGKTMYLVDSRGRETGALFEYDLASGKTKLVFEDEKTDVADVLINPETKVIEAVETDYDKAIWTLTERGMAIEPDFRAIRSQTGPGTLSITSRSLDDRFWTVAIISDSGPAKTYLVDRGDIKDAKRKVKTTLLFVNKPELAEVPLVPMHPKEIKTRDGLTMMCYLTLPLEADADRDGKAEKAVPMVLLVHGGPWARDSWGLDPESQWLANRGYAVLQVNFRGSTGFGKKFLNAGNREWGGKMHDDLLDAVEWAAKEGVAQRDKVAIMGGSYGGYATLAGLTFTPDAFACGVSIVGPSNIGTLIASIPPYWAPLLESFYARVGDPRTPEGKKLLEDRSPLTKAADIKRPLLIGQGANDPRVKQAESDQIVKAMQGHKIPVTYVLFPDEGHGFARPANNIAFNAVAEAFLAQHLGGRFEPIGEAFKGSTISVPAGEDGVPGLAEALKKKD